MGIKTFIEKITGVDKLKAELRAEAEAARNAAIEAQQLREEAEAEAMRALEEAEDAKRKEELAKLSPKERATRNGEPWVGVLDTHVNKDKPNVGYLELDWNDLFVVNLKQHGYGADGDPDEEIVDRWYRELAYNMYAESGEDPSKISAGYINVQQLDRTRSEVS